MNIISVLSNIMNIFILVIFSIVYSLLMYYYWAVKGGFVQMEHMLQEQLKLVCFIL